MSEQVRDVNKEVLKLQEQLDMAEEEEREANRNSQLADDSVEAIASHVGTALLINLSESTPPLHEDTNSSLPPSIHTFSESQSILVPEKVTPAAPEILHNSTNDSDYPHKQDSQDHSQPYLSQELF